VIKLSCTLAHYRRGFYRFSPLVTTPKYSRSRPCDTERHKRKKIRTTPFFHERNPCSKQLFPAASKLWLQCLSKKNTAVLCTAALPQSEHCLEWPGQRLLHLSARSCSTTIVQAITLHNAHPASDKARQQLPSAYPYARPACTSTQQKTKVLQEPVNQTGLQRHRKEHALHKPKRYSGLPTSGLSKKERLPALPCGQGRFPASSELPLHTDHLVQAYKTGQANT